MPRAKITTELGVLELDYTDAEFTKVDDGVEIKKEGLFIKLYSEDLEKLKEL